MANISQKDGFKPVGKIKQVVVQEAGSTVYAGDPVSLASDGQVDVTAAGSTINGIALNYATVGQKVLVSCDPEQIYSVQADETEINAQGLIGNNADHIVVAADTTYKSTRTQLDSSSATAGAAGFTILGLADGVSNSFGSVCKVLVRINEHQAFGKDAFGGI